MEALSDLLRRTLADPGHLLVFPTETSRLSWLEYVLTQGAEFGISCLREDRFLSWDSFKVKVFPRHDTALPANELYRTLFAIEVTELNEQQGILGYLIPIEYRDSALQFSRSIIRLTPVLKELNDRLFEKKICSEFSADIGILYELYEQFLSRYDLFEPSYEQRSIDLEALGATGVTILFPEVLQDYEQIRPLLEGCDRISSFSLPEQRELPPLKLYGNSLIEVSAALDRIEALLDSGVPIHDIAVTLADFQAMAPLLAKKAAERSIPLMLKSGRPITDYPVSSLFRLLSELVSDDFSLTAMKRLLLDPAIPWKEGRTNRELIRQGIESSCLRNYHHRGKKVDVWESRLAKAGKRELKEYYSLFKESVLSLCTCRDPSRLSSLFMAFQSRFLEPITEEGEKKDLFSFCLRKLEGFVQACEPLKFPDSFNVYQVFLSMLESSTYVPQQKSQGIAVYAYGLSSGLAVAHHLILSADAAHTSMRVDPFGMLSDQEAALLEVSPIDLGEELLALYGYCSQELELSCSELSRSGQQVPPSYFLERGTIERPETDRISDPNERERRLWAGELTGIERLYRPQLKAFEQALKTIAEKKELDLSTQRSKDEQVRELIKRRSRAADGYLEVSATSLDTYMRCPFSYLVKYLMHIEQEEYVFRDLDPRFLGKLIHSCIERFFLSLGKDRFEAEQQEEYRKRLTSIIERTLDEYMDHPDAPTRLSYWYLLQFLRQKLLGFVEKEADLFDRWRTRSAEGEYCSELTGSKVRLTGRIDRVAILDPGREAAVIDYKKKNHVRPSSFSSESLRCDSFQLPIYTYLLERQDPGTLEVVRAAYYDVSEMKYVSVLPYSYQRVVIDRERFEEVIDTMLEQIESMATHLGEADLRLHPSEGQKTCVRCDFRDICRGRFTVS